MAGLELRERVRGLGDRGSLSAPASALSQGQLPLTSRRRWWWRCVGVSMATMVSFGILQLSRCHGNHGNQAPPGRGSKFCYVTDFSSSGAEFQLVLNATPTYAHLAAVGVASFMHSGQPFLVSGVTANWPARDLWSHAYFQKLFSGHKLFSSTFSTSERPQFEDGHRDSEIYYGIFLNDPSLAALVANDYQYPEFIPAAWRVHGNEWIHWGQPPCGAKRHMDLMCTSRVSVQVAGSKRWRLYPLVSKQQLLSSGQANWTETLHPLQVTLHPGDALVWFPGWEHETGIETGLSISLSLHFTSPPHSHYINTFADLLSNHVSNSCHWGHSE